MFISYFIPNQLSDYSSLSQGKMNSQILNIISLCIRIKLFHQWFYISLYKVRLGIGLSPWTPHLKKIKVYNRSSSNIIPLPICFSGNLNSWLIFTNKISIEMNKHSICAIFTSVCIKHRKSSLSSFAQPLTSWRVFQLILP